MNLTKLYSEIKSTSALARYLIASDRFAFSSSMISNEPFMIKYGALVCIAASQTLYMNYKFLFYSDQLKMFDVYTEIFKRLLSNLDFKFWSWANLSSTNFRSALKYYYLAVFITLMHTALMGKRSILKQNFLNRTLINSLQVESTNLTSKWLIP